MSQVISKDGTPIAYERLGAGPALIVVEGALCSSAFGRQPTLAPLLARHFTVFMYDRRGRSASGDTPPYAKEREVEDIAALIKEAGGSAYLVGFSSGAALALEAAASGLNIKKVVAYEPPFMVDDDGHHARTNHRAALERLVAEGRRGAAVKYFMRDMVGIPAPFVFIMRLMFGMWRKLESVAHTLPYDAAVMGDWAVPAARFAAIQVPTLALGGEKTDPRLRRAVDAVTAAVPNAVRRTLKGQSHNVKADVLAPVLVEFFAS